MPIKILQETKKEQITEKTVIENCIIVQNADNWSVKFKNQVIVKLKESATLKEVQDYLKEEKNLVKKFIEKYKASNNKRVASIRARSKRIQQIKKQVAEEKIRQKYMNK